MDIDDRLRAAVERWNEWRGAHGWHVIDVSDARLARLTESDKRHMIKYIEKEIAQWAHTKS